MYNNRIIIDYIYSIIPHIKQFATFLKTSYEGNIGLCNFPLKEKSTHEKPGSSPPILEETHSNSRTAIDYNFLSAELRFVFWHWPLGLLGLLCFERGGKYVTTNLLISCFFKMFLQLCIKIENAKYEHTGNKDGEHT